MSVRLPQHLSKSTLKPSTLLHPLSLSVQRELIPCSSARMVLPEGEKISIKDFVRLYTINGDEGIFRVTAVAPAIPGGTDVVLSHGLCVLYDARMTGTGTLEGSLGDVVRQLLSHQVVSAGGTPLLAAGSFASGVTIRVEYSNSRVLDLLEEACEKAYTEKLTIDQSSIPWVVGSVALSNSPTAEGRFSRNLQSVRISMDDDDQCTRLIVEHTNWDTDEKSYTTHDADTIGEYGIIEDVWSVPYGATQAEESAYIAELFRQRKEPDTSIQIDAVDLFAVTGESLDRLDTGDLMRCCMPEYDTTINNRLMTVQYPDVFGDPHAARASLRNRHRRLSDMLRTVRQDVDRETVINNRRYGGSSAKIEQTNWQLQLTHEELVELDAYTKHTFNEVGIEMDALDASIELNTKSIETLYDETGVLAQEINQAGVRISGVEASVSLHASTLKTLGEDQQALEAELIVQSGMISTKVSNGEIASTLNQTPQSVLVDADKIDLIGFVTASQLSAEIAEINQFFSGVAEASVLKSTMVNCTGTLLYQDDAISKKALTMGTITSQQQAMVTGAIDLSHSHAVTVSDDGTVTLGGAQLEGGNFKIADTKTYKEGVAAAASNVTISRGSWSGGVLRPSTSTGKSVTVQLSTSQAWSGNKCTVAIDDAMGTNGAQVVSTGYSTVVDATSLVSAAQSAGASGVGISSYSGWQSSGVNTVTLSNGKSGNVSLPSFSSNSGSWSSGSRTATVYWVDKNGTNHTAKSVTVSMPSSATFSWSNPQQGYAMVKVTIGGKTYSDSKNVSGYT